MKTSFKNLIFWILFLTSIHASAQEMITSSQAEISPYLKKQLTSKLKNYQLLTLPLLPTTKNKEQLSFQLQTLTEKWEIELHPNEIRTPDCKIIEFDGKNSKELTVADCPTFAGTVNGYEARFYINSELLSGTIYQKDDILTIEPLSWFLATKEYKDVLIMFKESDIIETGGVCGVKSSGEQAKGLTSTLQNISSSALNCKILNVAVEYDWEFNANYGGYSQVMSIMNNVDLLYYNYIGNKVNVSWVGGWTTSNDPYSNTTLDGSLLGEFVTYWQNNRGYVSRNLAHMFTGKDLGNGFPGGISNGMANLTNICTGNSYSLSDRGAGGNDWQYVACHEIGHNLGHAGHDNDISDTFCNTRFIMCTGNNKVGSFSSTSQNIIRNYLYSSSCMTSGNTPVISCKLDGYTINSTPYYISSGGHYIYVINNSSLSTPPPPITSYSYSPSNGSVYYSPSGSSCYFYPNGVNSFTMQIVVTNACGNTYRAIPFVIYAAYKVYPNPSKDFVTIEFTIDDRIESYQALPIEISLWNETQLLNKTKPQELYQAKSLTSKNNKITLDVRNLERGVYYLHLSYSSEKVEEIKIILE